MPRNKLQVSDQQVLEWSESTINAELIRRVEEYKDFVQSARGVDAFHPFEPQRTQEVLCGLNAIVDTLDIVVELLEGNWEPLELDDASEED